MKNWLNQELEVGDLVYNGQRDGNTSVFRIGRIVSFPEVKTHDRWGDPIKRPEQKVKVRWLRERSLMLGSKLPYVPESTLNVENIVKVELDTAALGVVE